MRNTAKRWSPLLSRQRLSGGILTNNMGEGRMAHVARNDCAEAAACVAAGAGENNKVYYITGPTANTMDEFVTIGSEVTGKKVVYHYIDDDAMWAFFRFQRCSTKNRRRLVEGRPGIPVLQ